MQRKSANSEILPSCHATGRRMPKKPMETDRARRAAESGVSCQACHGPADIGRSPPGKMGRCGFASGQSKLGFTNVRDPWSGRTLCILPRRQRGGREIVKHEWYAGSPLPGFEFAAFAAQMPAHWKPLVTRRFRRPNRASKPVPDAGDDRAPRRNIDIPEVDVKANYREANFPEANDSPFANLPRTQGDSFWRGCPQSIRQPRRGLYGRSYKGNKRFTGPSSPSTTARPATMTAAAGWINVQAQIQRSPGPAANAALDERAAGTGDGAKAGTGWGPPFSGARLHAASFWRPEKNRGCRQEAYSAAEAALSGAPRCEVW